MNNRFTGGLSALTKRSDAPMGWPFPWQAVSRRDGLTDPRPKVGDSLIERCPRTPAGLPAEKRTVENDCRYVVPTRLLILHRHPASAHGEYSLDYLVEASTFSGAYVVRSRSKIMLKDRGHEGPRYIADGDVIANYAAGAPDLEGLPPADGLQVPCNDTHRGSA